VNTQPRFGGLDLLREALDAVRNAVWSQYSAMVSQAAWLLDGSLCRARHHPPAGEFNGFLKPKVRLFSEPLCFVAGELVLPAGYSPTIDADMLAAHEVACERFAPITARSATQPA
jgi:hypothetical protein